MSEWSHNICVRCWRRREPDREPVKINYAPVEPCCFCDQVTQMGIYVRHDPKDPMLTCGGEHEPEMVVG